MGWGKIKIDKADTLFSLYIRARDGKCMRCHKAGLLNRNNLPVLGLHCSHFFSRRSENTRFEPDNCDALCPPCHFRWGGDYREEYTAFKKKQLGEKRFKMLEVQHNTYKKKDRLMAMLQAKALLESL